MAELNEFLKPRVEGPTVEFSREEGVLETAWKIPFTQYMLPYGRKKPNPYICFDKDIAEKAQKILDAGFRFDIEVLSTGAVSATIGGQLQYAPDESPEDSDVAMVLAFNGPDVPVKIDGMIRDFEIPEDGVVKRY
jgi:hypothetical protein